jgi:hypothetical protein
LNEIEIVIGEHKLNLNARVGVQKTFHQRSKVPAAEQSRCSYPQETAQRRIALSVRLADGITIVPQQAPSLSGKALSRLSW